MSPKLRAIVSASVAVLLTLITLPVVFNLLPGTARLVAPLVCQGAFVIVESGRRRGHEYLCDVGTGQPGDVTVLASLLTAALVVAVWFAVVYAALAIRQRRSQMHTPR